MAVTLLASQCPSPPVPSAILNPAGLVPTVSKALAAGDRSRLLTVVNENAARADAVGRWGGGAWAVAFGLGISIGTGLAVNVATGQAVIDNVVTLDSTLAVGVLDGITRGYLWLSQAGTVTVVNNSLTPPAGAYCFLGSFVSAAGAVSSVDTSGVLYLKGGQAVRFTADTSCPTDSPPAQLTCHVFGGGGVWYWDGTRYWCVTGGRAALTFSSDANKTLTSVEASNRMIDFTSGGTTLTATRNVVVPTEAGASWVVRNNSPGAQSLVVKTSAGTGITLLTGKVQHLLCDGTDIVAVAAAV